MKKQAKNPLKGRAPAKRRRKPAKRTPTKRAEVVVAAPAAAEPVIPAEINMLTEDVVLGALGLVELKLTAGEEAVLSRPVNPDEILIKPQGQPYLSHPTYTRWFNEAFGRLGWSLVPRSKPSQQGDAVVQGYVLYIHGKPVAFAWGEQGWKSSNRDQSYGDALEATVASALRRCAKRLGVGLEMWDKPFLNRWVDEYAVRVPVTRKDYRSNKEETKYEWRRKVDPPLRGEQRSRHSRRVDAAGDYEEAEQDGQPGRQQATGRREGQRGGGSPEARQRPPQAAREASRPPVEEEPPLDDAEFEGYTARTAARSQASPAPAPRHNPADGEAITPNQLTRLHSIVTNSGRNPDAVKTWLLTTYGLSSSKDLKRRDYDAVIRLIESPGSLVLGRKA